MWRWRDAFRVFQQTKIKIVHTIIVQYGLASEAYKGKDLYV